MSKLNIYRSILIICLAAIVYVWPFAAIIIAGWWGTALIGAWAKKVDPSHGESSLSKVLNADSFGALSAWLGLWNGFYVWKDLDHDYHRRNRE
ncbi:hypothetical protein AMK06_PD00411 (plasmid) [Rhizobium sp. N541]|nr:hypothetical protein AMK05_PD00409 [Rhizobium sp. N324]ANM20689.1 hypothetical protein AMK06_PD00411 [Rhizobium sp. N541]ANM27073.1 hypothetical protein AMK07_PD00411 [Rhizobium sp. N941]OYD00478.1 hypothetical protein AMK08_PD00409 [Rhizobium sp. N4311]